MSSQDLKLNFSAAKSCSSSESTEEDISSARQTIIKHSQPFAKPSNNIKSSKYFQAAQPTAIRHLPTFLGIPQTIRDHVYHSIYSNSLIHVSRRHHATTPSIKNCSTNHILLWKPHGPSQNRKAYIHYESSRSLSILSVSRQTRQEAMPFYTALSFFRIHGPATMCVDWLRTLSPQERKMLNEVRFSDPDEHLSVLAGALRKDAMRESLGGVLGEMRKTGVELEDGVLRVRHVEGRKIRWESASAVKVEMISLVEEEMK